jgi:hypothetical protein
MIRTVLFVDDLPARYRPYRAEDGAIRLVQSVVLSLDLLGTRASAAEEAQRYLDITHEALHRANRWAEGGKASETIVRWFSDNLALADPLELDDPRSLTFGFHLVTAGWMQVELAMMGLFARGGMALGPFYANETFVYGPALIDAYEAESRTAIYPRVVLTKAAADFARQDLINFGGGDVEVHRKLLAVDRDGVPFLNYLHSVYDEPEDLEAMLLNHKAHITSRLDEHLGDARVHLKYAWLADYHDRFCRLNFAAGHREDLMIGPTEGPSLTPFGEEIPKPEPPPHSGLSF